MGFFGSLLGGGGKSSSTSSTSTSKTTNVKTVNDSSVTDLTSTGGGVVLEKNGRGSQIFTSNGIGGDELSDIIGSLSGAQAAAFDAISQSGQAVRDIAQSTTGTQTETGKIIGQLALPVGALLGLIFFFRRR